MTKDELRALAVAATPGPWHIQYGDDASHRCMTAISTRSTRLNNQGCFTESEFESLIAITLHQSYPWVDPDCKNDDSNSAYISAMDPTTTLALLDEIERLRTAAQAGLEALCLPCDRWNKTQSEIVNAAISLLRVALECGK